MRSFRLLPLLLAPLACRQGSGGGDQGRILVEDGLGREVRLERPADRIVSLAPAHTEILFALGAGDRLRGRDAFSDHPPAALEVPSIGSVHPRPNLESVLLLYPDLALAGGTMDPSDVRALEGLGIPVYASGVIAGLEDVYADILAVSRLCGLPSEGDRLVAGLVERVTAVRERVRSAATRPLVFYEIDGSDPARPWTAGPSSFIGELIELAGGRNLGDAGSTPYFQVSIEELVARDPEIILLGSAARAAASPELVAARPGWSSLSAVKTGAVHPIDDDIVSRPGPRVALGLESIARRIHPELFR